MATIAIACTLLAWGTPIANASSTGTLRIDLKAPFKSLNLSTTMTPISSSRCLTKSLPLAPAVNQTTGTIHLNFTASMSGCSSTKSSASESMHFTLTVLFTVHKKVNATSAWMGWFVHLALAYDLVGNGSSASWYSRGFCPGGAGPHASGSVTTGSGTVPMNLSTSLEVAVKPTGQLVPGVNYTVSSCVNLLIGWHQGVGGSVHLDVIGVGVYGVELRSVKIFGS
jgi:hypothetical protein